MEVNVFTIVGRQVVELEVAAAQRAELEARVAELEAQLAEASRRKTTRGSKS